MFTDNTGYNAVMVSAGLMVVFMVISDLDPAWLPSPYGRFSNHVNLKHFVSSKLGWLLLELPATVFFVYFFFLSPTLKSTTYPEIHSTAANFLAFVYLTQYTYRGFLYPFLIRSSSSKFSLETLSYAFFVTFMQGYLSAYHLRYYGVNLRLDNYMTQRHFILGLLLYYPSFFAVIYHDYLILSLRTPNNTNKSPSSSIKTQYKIPHGGLFEFSSSAQYFVEILMWIGFALMFWGPNGLFMLLVTILNLTPRANSTHKWYHQTFGDKYPEDRKILIPFVW